MFCKYCGKEIDDDSIFCAHCGMSVKGDSDVSQKTQITPLFTEVIEEAEEKVIKENDEAMIQVTIQNFDQKNDYKQKNNEGKKWNKPLVIFIIALIVIVIFIGAVVKCVSSGEVPSEQYVEKPIATEELVIVGEQKVSYNQYSDELVKAAQAGDAQAQNRLGLCYANGEGVDQNYVEAVKWYIKAVANGSEKVLELINEICKIAEKGNVDAQYALGYYYANGKGVSKDYVEAVKWYTKAAKQGNADAQYDLGRCYYYGNGVEQDYGEAVKWYKKAAEQGVAEAQYSLGLCYEDGKGVKQSYMKAIQWLIKAAEQGNATAQSYLGYCYYDGKGVPKNYEEAVKWFRKAADQGDAFAQYLLGSCYENGWGVGQNTMEAVRWFRKAADQGNAFARGNLQRLGY